MVGIIRVRRRVMPPVRDLPSTVAAVGLRRAVPVPVPVHNPQDPHKGERGHKEHQAVRGREG